MDKYTVRDVQGRTIHLYERTSILLTLVMVLLVLSFLASLAMGVLSIMDGAMARGGGLLALSILTLIYVFVFNHLRRKGDMDVDRAALPMLHGGVVEVRKKASIWITLAYALTILFIIIALGVTAYGAYLLSTGGGISLLAAGLGGLIGGILYALVLRFLRTKLDFEGSRALLRSLEGYVLELYKSRSIWLTLAMILTLLAALALLGLGALALVKAQSIKVPSGFTAAKLEEGHAAIYEAGGLIFLGLLLLVNAAVLNFLSTKAHIRVLEEESRRTTTRSPRPYSSEEYIYGEEIEEHHGYEEPEETEEE